MRQLAGQLKTAAKSLDSACHNIDGCVHGMTFDGPAGERFRGKMHGVDGAVRDAASQLRDVAGRLERSADEVDARQRAHDAAILQNQNELRIKNLERMDARV